ncbi:HesA/MoeB/ThiF family protein [Loktanella sp. R86503]|uniref:HesA/MoeB/ThiF family protein n=1 Tax=Loktanella sp. R86503 TaxID=3093847 RepID=UPI0036DABCD5
MIFVGFLAALIWRIGAAMEAPRRARWIMLAALITAVIAAQLTLPAGHSLREATGGDVRLWLLILGFAALVWGYTAVLRAVKSRARPEPVADVPTRAGLSDDELQRYARHIMLREVGGTGQAALARARVLVIGAGGLGSPALQYLAASGVGTIGIIDDDVVDHSNLQRQVIYGEADVGQPKVQIAAQEITRRNHHVTVRPYQRRLTAEIAADLIADYDLVMDGCDNFDTRYLVNQTCTALGVPLIAAAMTQWEGQISFYDPARGTPCFACVFPERPAPGLVPSCAEAGVIGPLPGVMGAMMALEAVKAITGAGLGLGGRMLIYDALYADTRIMQASVRADCAVCKGKGLQAGAQAAKV